LQRSQSRKCQGYLVDKRRVGDFTECQKIDGGLLASYLAISNQPKLFCQHFTLLCHFWVQKSEILRKTE